MIDEILDLIYPKDLYCICCGKIIDWSRTYRLCDDCIKNIKWNTGRVCEKCGKRLADNNPKDICFNCSSNSHVFRKGYSCSEYGTHERYIVMGFKYGNKLHIGETIGEMLTDRMQSLIGKEELRAAYDLLVPVPLSKARERVRGYNQTQIIAAHFAEQSKLCLRNASYRSGKIKLQEPLIRIRDTSAMKGLTPDERKENVRGSFAAREGFREKISGANCLVIDDIYTTGATIDEISSTLYGLGARNVDFLSFASGADVIKS